MIGHSRYSVVWYLASLGAFQTGYIALRRALQSENNHGSHIEGSFQIEVLKTSHFKGPHRNEGFRRVQLMNSSGPLDPLHDDGASVWPRDDDAEGHFKKQLLGPLHPLKLSLRRVNPLNGLWHSIGMSPSEWNARANFKIWRYFRASRVTCSLALLFHKTATVVQITSDSEWFCINIPVLFLKEALRQYTGKIIMLFEIHVFIWEYIK